jgi:hypothetical protein
VWKIFGRVTLWNFSPGRDNGGLEPISHPTAASGVIAQRAGQESMNIGFN